jgi:hypothetical protein
MKRAIHNKRPGLERSIGFGGDAGRMGRRQFLASTGAGFLALSGLNPAMESLLQSEDASGKARSVIHVWLSGGLSHLDSFDPKPYAPVEVRGPYDAMDTNVVGIQFSEHMKQLAKRANQLLIVRSMTHGEAAHERGSHSMLTGYRPSPAVSYPSFGSVVTHELGSREDLPAYICVPGDREPSLGPGYLSQACAPFHVGGEPRSSNFAVRDLEAPKNTTEAQVARRRHLLMAQDADFQSAVAADSVRALETFYRQAYDLLDSTTAKAAFDIKQENGKDRNRYGMTNLGQRLLLSRRLVESGARWVTVTDNGYDHHRDLSRNLRPRLVDLDLGLAALIDDLKERDLLSSTLVLVSSEFGRTPRINQDSGRDHWARCFSVMLAGGGLKQGTVHGASDATGSEPETDPVRPEDLAATVFHLMGLDPTKKLMSPGNRPIDLVRDGKIQSSWIA